MEREPLRWMERLTQAQIMALASVLLAAVAYFDYLTTIDISWTSFYWIPLFIVVWFAGMPLGLAMSLACVATAFAVQYLGGKTWRQPGFLVWDLINQTSSFMLFGWLIWFLRRISAAEARARQKLEARGEELEQQVRARTQSLETSLAHMRAFSNSIAHDLIRPVRSVTIFSELLRENAGRLDEPALDYLRRLALAGRRLNEMLNGLIVLGQISDRTLSSATVDLAELSRRIFAELQAAEPRRRVDLRAPASLPVWGDPDLLRILLQKLIENAWKFTRDNPAARIEVGIEARGVEEACFVRDNGIGFDPASASGLFQPFHRLRQADGFPGEGVGLACAARAVEAHGGRIWAEAAPGRGATFYFTLEERPRP